MGIMTDQATPDQPQPFTAVEPGTRLPRDAEELLEASVGPVQAEDVHLERSSAASVTAARATMRQSSTRRVEAGSLQMQQSAAGLVRTTDLALHDSAAFVVSTTEARVADSVVFALRAKTVTGEGRNTVFMNIGPAGEHQTTVLSGQAAMRLGASLALSLLVFGRVFRLIFGRSR